MWSKCVHTIRNGSLTVIAIHRVSCIVLISAKSASLFANCKFGDLEIILFVFKSHDNVGVKRMTVLFGVFVSVRRTEAIETFHAYEESMLVCLNDENKVTGSWKHLTHWSLKIFLPWRDFV